MNNLDKTMQTIIGLRLDGWSQNQIGSHVGLSRYKVIKKLREFQENHLPDFVPIRKPGKALRGQHSSPKCESVIHYRSKMELQVCQILDGDDSVKSYEYEPFKLKYWTSKNSNKCKTYKPDFLVFYTDGSKKLIEVKPKKRLNNSTVCKKANAARSWCKENYAIFEFWTEKELNNI